MSIRVFPVVSQVAKRVLHPQVIPWINFTLSENVIALRRFLNSLHTKLETGRENYYRAQTKLRKSNVFTPVCDSVHREVCIPACIGADTPLADIPLPSACWDTHTPAQCMLGYTPPPRRPLLRTVCIPLECILVFDNFCFHTL